MWKENNEVSPPRTPETLAHEEAMKEFATSAAEFMSHVALLTKARDAYQRAMAISTQLRDKLDKGDEILKTLMGKIEQALQFGEDAAGKKNPGAEKVGTKPGGEKADAARA